MPNTPLLVLMCGLSFAGKTTIARALAAHHGWRYLSLDAINTERGVGLNNQEILPHEWEETYAQAYQRVEDCLRGGHSLVYDETNMLRAQRDQLRGIAARQQARACVLYVATTAEQVRQRWQENRQNPQRGDVRDDNFNYVIEHFEPPGSDEGLILYDPSLPLHDWIARVFPLEQQQNAES